MVRFAAARIVITGRTQTGKTSFLRCAVLHQLNAYIIYDPDNQFTGYGVLVTTIPELIKAIKQGHRKIVFQVRDILMRGDMGEARREEFELLCQIIVRLRNVTFIIDEISEVTRPTGKKIATMPPTLGLIIKRRMKSPYNIGVIVTTQRMKDADVDFITQAQLTYTFQQNSSDAKYVAERLGMNTRDLRELIETLPPYHYLKYNHTTRALTRGTFEWFPPPKQDTHPIMMNTLSASTDDSL